VHSAVALQLCALVVRVGDQRAAQVVAAGRVAGRAVGARLEEGCGGGRLAACALCCGGVEAAVAIYTLSKWG